jgi:hypothetical protein
MEITMSLRSEFKKRKKERKIAEAATAAKAAQQQETWLQRIARESEIEYDSVAEVLATDGNIAYFYNDGEVAIGFVGNNSVEVVTDNDFLRVDVRDVHNASRPEGLAPLFRASFRALFPLNDSIVSVLKFGGNRIGRGIGRINDIRDKMYAALDRSIPVNYPTMVPHYMQQDVLNLFKNNDPRIATNVYGLARALELSQEPGYFTYSEKNGGGIATFWVDDENGNGHPVFTTDVELSDEIRSAKCGNPECECDAKWTEILYNCGCKHHHEGERVYLLPRFELCSTTECDGQHAHLLGFCTTCFLGDLNDGKSLAEAGADNFQHRVYDPTAEATDVAVGA